MVKKQRYISTENTDDTIYAKVWEVKSKDQKLVCIPKKTKNIKTGDMVKVSKVILVEENK